MNVRPTTAYWQTQTGQVADWPTSWRPPGTDRLSLRWREWTLAYEFAINYSTIKRNPEWVEFNGPRTASFQRRKHCAGIIIIITIINCNECSSLPLTTTAKYIADIHMHGVIWLSFKAKLSGYQTLITIFGAYKRPSHCLKQLEHEQWPNAICGNHKQPERNADIFDDFNLYNFNLYNI